MNIEKIFMGKIPGDKLTKVHLVKYRFIRIAEKDGMGERAKYKKRK